MDLGFTYSGFIDLDFLDLGFMDLGLPDTIKSENPSLSTMVQHSSTLTSKKVRKSKKKKRRKNFNYFGNNS